MTFNFSEFRIFAFTLAILMPGLGPLAYTGQDTDYLRNVDPALGIGKQFGRWNGTITLVYDPDGAPAIYADPDDVLALLEEAAGEWELVSGIRFNVAGSDPDIPDDDAAAPEDKDGIVRVHWTDTGGAAGRAGPDGDYYDSDLGYYPYIDGSVELNEDPATWDYKRDLVDTLVHELGHLMGLGHSDNPDSVMYANPYNHLLHPRADDILAARALYGNGSLAISDVTRPIARWVYDPLPDAPASVTQYLFKANQFSDSGAFISVASDEPVTQISDSTTDDGFVRFNFGGIGNFNNSQDIDIDATLVVVDPFGYVYSERDHQVTCKANTACDGGWVSVTTSASAKTVPGTWTVYVVDDNAGTTLTSKSFEVTTNTVFNQAPTATVSLSGVAGTQGNTVKISLVLSDPEGNDIDVIWHPHGDLGDQDHDGYTDTGITDSAGDGDTVSRNIAFLTVDTHTLYIELVDNEPRYNGGVADSSAAGDGFQSLIAVTVSLPFVSDGDASVVTSYLTNAGGGASDDNDAVVAAIADSQSLQNITALDGKSYTSTSAAFGAGASADDGATTATDFADGDSIIIAGSLTPQAEDVGKAAEIYVVLYSTTDKTVLSFRDVDGNFDAWGGSLKDGSLGPAYAIGGLLATESFEVYAGPVQSGLYRVFLGYRLTSGGPLHFNTNAFRINVD